MATNILVTQSTDETLIEGSVVAIVRTTQAADETLIEGPVTANVRFTQDVFEVLTEGHTFRNQTGKSSIILNRTKPQTGKAAIKKTASRSQSGVGNIGSSLAVGSSDSLSIGITDDSTVTQTTVTEPNDNLSVTLTESSTLTITTDVIISSGDTLNIECDDSTPGFVFPDGERVDHLVIGLTESASISCFWHWWRVGGNSNPAKY